MWTDIACIVFACVTINHLGMIAAIKSVTKRNRLPVLDCPKCLSFWATLCCQLVTSCNSLPQMLSISFLCAYLAIWLELAEGFIDKLYDYVYKQIYSTADTDSTDAECS